MDVLVNIDTLPADAHARVLDYFKPAAHVRNGPVLSFDYDNFQVDLIRYGQPEYDFAKHYFAYNDLGNLIGRVARRMGFVFGHAGLFYVLRDPHNEDRVIEKIAVTQDFDTALVFLGYNPYRYKQGFNTLEDIFAYVASSAFYTNEAFSLEKRGHRARVRGRKRPTYQAFLRWAFEQAAVPGKLAGKSKAANLSCALHESPSFAQRYREALRNHEAETRLKAYFNGRRVAAITGMSGSALGAAMAGIVRAEGGKTALRMRLLLAIDKAATHSERMAVADSIIRELWERETAL